MKLHYIIISNTYTPALEQKIFNYAFTERVNAEDYAAVINRHTPLTKIASVREIDLPFIGRSVCYVKQDAGIGGGFDMPIYEKIWNSRIYSCMNHAKSDDLWKESIEFFKKNPDEKMHETNTMIATDHYGKPFSWGHYDGFVTTIERIRVIKAEAYLKFDAERKAKNKAKKTTAKKDKKAAANAAKEANN